jgi:hypothetical protein
VCRAGYIFVLSQHYEPNQLDCTFLAHVDSLPKLHTQNGFRTPPAERVEDLDEDSHVAAATRDIRNLLDISTIAETTPPRRRRDPLRYLRSHQRRRVQQQRRVRAERRHGVRQRVEQEERGQDREVEPAEVQAQPPEEVEERVRDDEERL